MKKRRMQGRPRIYDGRNPDETLIRSTLSKRAAPGGDIYWLMDEVEKILGRKVARSYVSMIVSGERRNPQIQKAVARALGLSYSKAFPKPEKPLPRAEGRLKDSTHSPLVLDAGRALRKARPVKSGKSV